LKYDILEKWSYALIKALKYFWVYVLHSKIIANVPSSAIRYILVHPNNEGKRGKWIAKLLEYDVDIKPTKLIKGQGLAKLLAESNYKALGMNHINNLSEEGENNKPRSDLQVHEKYHSSNWYKDIVHLLQHLQTPPNIDKSKGRSLRLKVDKYCIINKNLCWKDPRGFLLKCLDEDESRKVLTEMHARNCGGQLY